MRLLRNIVRIAIALLFFLLFYPINGQELSTDTIIIDHPNKEIFVVYVDKVVAGHNVKTLSWELCSKTNEVCKEIVVGSIIHEEDQYIKVNYSITKIEE